jgi:hypothetical protein
MTQEPKDKYLYSKRIGGLWHCTYTEWNDTQHDYGTKYSNSHFTEKSSNSPNKNEIYIKKGNNQTYKPHPTETLVPAVSILRMRYASPKLALFNIHNPTILYNGIIIVTKPQYRKLLPS